MFCQLSRRQVQNLDKECLPGIVAPVGRHIVQTTKMHLITQLILGILGFCQLTTACSQPTTADVERCSTHLTSLGQSQIPFLSTRGCSSFLFGKAIGGTFSQKIQHRLQTSAMGVLRVNTSFRDLCKGCSRAAALQSLTASLQDFADSEAGSAMLAAFAALNAATYPQFFQELIGIAAGSGSSMQEARPPSPFVEHVPREHSPPTNDH